MTLNKNELRHISPADIDSRGALRIPAGITSVEHGLMSFIQKCGIDEISYHACKRIKRAPIMFFRNKMYVATRQVHFGETTLYELSTPEFNADGLCGETYYALTRNGAKWFDKTIDDVIKSARLDIWTRLVDYAVDTYNAPRYAGIIVAHALNATVQIFDGAPIDMQTRRYIEAELSRLKEYFIGINTFCDRYKNNKEFDELYSVTLQELGDIVLPIQSQKLGKTCTRLVKRRPVNARHVHAMMNAGYKNPGCFPYQWLARTPVQNRGAVTDALHAAFGDAARDLYSPAYMAKSKVRDKFNTVLDTLACRINEITGVNAKIEYCSRGYFAQTYKITCNIHAYLLKVYHSNVPYQTAKDCAHDIEAQNSFLVSGKKYCGRVRYRKVLTAGISNQRGMRYILYPFVSGAMRNIKHNPYDIFKTYQFRDDFENGNLCGNTIIDTGLIHVNECRIGRPYMTKIINTILYRPWDDLTVVLNKYTPRQISECIEFIFPRIGPDTPHKKTIHAKLEFLNNKIRTR